MSLLEQPLRRGCEADLDGYRCPIPIAADESALGLDDVAGLVGRFDVFNIKLDKCGGLTEALLIAEEARRLGLGVMVGNMVGTSLAMAPAFIVGQHCDVVDLDGPTFLTHDRTPVVRISRRHDLVRQRRLGIEARGMNEPAEPSNWFGQPRGLTILFLTNMWETFSYYGMRALLVYYMTKQLLISQQHSSLIYGTYTSFAYFTPIVGGAIADRYLGKKRAVIIGATTMAAGHFMMAFEPLFYFALATIALGNGLFLPSLPSQINDLYGPDDPRRGWAYNVYYVGVNVGGFLAPLICGTLGETFGWHYGFGAAGVGMLAGLAHLPCRPALPAVLANTGKYPSGASAGAALGSRRDTFMLLLGVGLAVTVFRGSYEQVGNTVALWIEGVNRHVGSREIPMTWFQSLNPLLVIVLTPFLLARWRRRADAGREHSPLQKMATGALIVGGAYALLALASALAPTGASWLWLAGLLPRPDARRALHLADGTWPVCAACTA